MNEKGHRKLDNLGRAVARLLEALDVSPDAPLAIDGTIQRFEFAFELGWKTIKAALEYEGVEVQSPRSALSEAVRFGWIDEVLWFDMFVDRNKSSHEYSEEEARSVYERIKTYAPALKAVHALLARQYPPPSIGLFP